MLKKLMFLVIVISLSSPVYACGWFTYEDIEDTRTYYNAYDELEGIEDGMLLISRSPSPSESKVNVYIPMNYNG